MAYRQIDKTTYDALTAAFRDKPGNYANAARVAKCDSRMARAGWNKGWVIKRVGISYPPIRDLLVEEQREARARMQEEAVRQSQAQEEMRARARTEAIDSRAEFGKLLKNSGQLTAAMTGIIGKLLPLGLEVAQSLASDPAGLKALPVRQRAKFLFDLTEQARTLVAAVREHQESIHSHFGEPDKILGIQIDPDQMSPEQMVESLKLAAQEAIDYERIFLGKVIVPAERSDALDEHRGTNGSGTAH